MTRNSGNPTVERYLARSGGRLACPHPTHRVAQVDNSPSSIILPECAGQTAWLKARMGGIGGSEVGALVGVSEYETALSVWNTKTNGGKDLSAVAAVEWGHRLEDVVAQKTAEEIGLVSRFAGGLWAYREHPHRRVTPDRFACRPRSWRALGLIECKTAGDEDDWASGTINASGSGSGLAPLGYQAQLQWQLGLLGLRKGWLGCLVLGRERSFFVVEVDFNAEWFGELVDEADRFWVKHVLGDEIPMATLRHPKTEELLKAMKPNVVQPSTILPAGSETWLTDYRERKDALDKAQADMDEIKNYFRMMTGDAGAGYLEDGRKVVSYPEVPSTRIDVEALRREAPEVAERFTVRSTHRRLTINPNAKFPKTAK